MDVAGRDGPRRADSDDRYGRHNASDIVAKDCENDRRGEIFGMSTSADQSHSRTSVGELENALIVRLSSLTLRECRCSKLRRLRRVTASISPRSREYGEAAVLFAPNCSNRSAKHIQSRLSGVESMLLDKTFADLFNSRVSSLRKAVVAFNENGIPSMCFPRPSITSTPSAPSGCPPTSSRPNATTSAHTRISGSTKKAHSTRRIGISEL